MLYSSVLPSEVGGGAAPAAEAGALGCAGTNRHGVKECKPLTAKGEPPTLAPRHALPSVTGVVKR